MRKCAFWVGWIGRKREEDKEGEYRNKKARLVQEKRRQSIEMAKSN